ncbi:hypothetical protein PHAVU_006G116100 [Phaseolus vulgaris]|uniref:Uncharacterized protein n=1 Tax=Phaseolus vulgaris TaxID=3885 RepID=V7BQP5_PHAVU|nr:hypothetical protein PHAVU_006G116100g [Phaseolus vulgaris]ESW19338.1 hypothetical protein PHAVU_006G116100g [Phaseolus vulgaris]
MLGISFKQLPQTKCEGEQEVKDVVMLRKEIPKGCMKIKVGGEGEEQQKITVPVNYLKHPLFVQLLKEAEEEYGFAHKGNHNYPLSTRPVQARSALDRCRHLPPPSPPSSPRSLLQGLIHLTNQPFYNHFYGNLGCVNSYIYIHIPILAVVQFLYMSF